MKSIRFNHVTTEVYRFEIELTDDILEHLKTSKLDLDNPEHEDDIIEAVRDFHYDWIELSNYIVDGHFQDGELIR